MKWRVIEPWRGAYRVQRKGGLFWVWAVFAPYPYGPYPLTFNNEESAREAMEQAILDWKHERRVVVEVESQP